MRSRPLALHFGQGLLMGGADVIPGVSGGTVALIVGIYERLVASIRALVSALVTLARGDRVGARHHLRAVEWRLILPLGAGIVCAIAVGSIVIPPLRSRFPIGMRALFLGLVAGSVPIPWRRIEQVGPSHVGIAAAAAVTAFVLVGVPPREVVSPSLLVVAPAAAVAICAMILPGVSGAFLLESMGLYDPTLEALRELDVAYIAVFVGSAAVGLAVFVKVLGWLLARWHAVTMAALVGLMVGALRALWPWLDADRALLPPPLSVPTLRAVLLVAVGFAAVTLVTRRGATRSPGRKASGV